MRGKRSMKVKWGMPVGVLLAVFGLFLVPLSQASAATIVIDDFTVQQGSSAAAALQKCDLVPPTTLTNAKVGPVANIVGGNRILEITHTAGVTPCTSAYVDGGVPPAFVVVNDTFSTGWGRVIWSGGPNVNDYLLNLDLSALVWFNILFLSTDHPTTFYLQVYSAANQGSQATVAFPNPGGGSQANVHLTPASFSTIGGLTAANFASIKRIVLLFDPFEEIDVAVRAITAETNPPDIDCNYKYLNGTSSLTLPFAQVFPVNLTVTGSVSNVAGASGDRVVIQDTLPAGMTYVAGSTAVTSPAGFVLGEPLGGPNGPLVWTSTSNLNGGQTLVFTFTVSLAALNVGEVKTNIIQARAFTEQTFEETCPATITRTPEPPKAPALSGWGLMVVILCLTVCGFFLIRRRNQAI